MLLAYETTKSIAEEVKNLKKNVCMKIKFLEISMMKMVDVIIASIAMMKKFLRELLMNSSYGTCTWSHESSWEFTSNLGTQIEIWLVKCYYWIHLDSQLGYEKWKRSSSGMDQTVSEPGRSFEMQLGEVFLLNSWRGLLGERAHRSESNLDSKHNSIYNEWWIHSGCLEGVSRDKPSPIMLHIPGCDRSSTRCERMASRSS